MNCRLETHDIEKDTKKRVYIWKFCIFEIFHLDPLDFLQDLTEQDYIDSTYEDLADWTSGRSIF